VAQLAGVSVDYYVRLERGRGGNVSEAVLDALSRALGLDDTERSHLFALARPSRPRRRPAPPQRIRPGLYQVLESLATVPAVIFGRRWDVLASNSLARALYTDFDALPYRERNMVRYLFLDDAARDLYQDWAGAARSTVASLRLYAGRHPDDPSWPSWSASSRCVTRISAAGGPTRTCTAAATAASATGTRWPAS
jgi:transcriptional regulator with XRE-family HTH domain